VKTTVFVAAWVALGVLAGCSTGAETEDPPPPPAALEPAPPGTEESTDSSLPGEAPEPSSSSCSDDTREAIEDTVVGQVSAFSDGDFETAYTYASPSFRAGVPLDVFGQIIRTNYPQLLDASNARSGPCDADLTNGLATIVMAFNTQDDPSYTLRYVLERVDEQWLISGAAEETISRDQA